MRFITLKKNGTAEITDIPFPDDDGTKHDPITYPLTNKNIFKAFDIHDVRMEDGVNVGSFMKMLIHYPILQNIQDFADSYVEFFKNIELFPEKNLNKPFDKIVVCNRYIFLLRDYYAKSRFEKTGNGTSRLVRGEPEPRNIEDESKASALIQAVGMYENDEETYSLSFCSLADIIDCEVSIGGADFYFTEDYKFSENEEGINSLSTKINDFYPSLFDILHSILREITAFGLPEDRDEFKNNLVSDLNKTIEGMDDE